MTFFDVCTCEEDTDDRAVETGRSDSGGFSQSVTRAEGVETKGSAGVEDLIETGNCSIDIISATCGDCQTSLEFPSCRSIPERMGCHGTSWVVCTIASQAGKGSGRRSLS